MIFCNMPSNYFPPMLSLSKEQQVLLSCVNQKTTKKKKKRRKEKRKKKKKKNRDGSNLALFDGTKSFVFVKAYLRGSRVHSTMREYQNVRLLCERVKKRGVCCLAIDANESRERLTTNGMRETMVRTIVFERWNIV